MQAAGARTIRVGNLPCMDRVQRDRLDIYDAALGRSHLEPTKSSLVKIWLEEFEDELKQVDVAAWLP